MDCIRLGEEDVKLCVVYILLLVNSIGRCSVGDGGGVNTEKEGPKDRALSHACGKSDGGGSV